MTVEEMMTNTISRVEAAATDILTLVEGLGAEEFARSRLMRRTVLARLRAIADAAASLPAQGREAMPEVDWASWVALGDALANGAASPEHEWAAASEQAAVILQWMRVYSQTG
ncbi:MAG: hypothetical protein RBT39_14290 [Azoarcus sp.]|jgi:uncharacterized protein with HEPN domain|nr:hypothetical protein [Azoarcus sp.]MDD2873377.1 hypothetical protein [Azoarcus sp.]MDX9838727.1 hypothetical protein [Azoarcus sp.]